MSFWRCLAMCLLAPACALGQGPVAGRPAAGRSGSRAIQSFQSSVRRVLVPVCVISRKGQVVAGLDRSDFRIFVDGKPVPVRSLDWITAGTAGTVAGLRRPAAGAFANPPRAAPASWVVLLIDFQNTSLEDMMWMREGVLRFLRRDLAPGQPVAIFGMSGGLLLLQPFTTSRNRLLAAAERWIRPRLDWNLAFTPPLAPRLPGPGQSGPNALASPGGQYQHPRTAWSEAERAAWRAGLFPTDAALRQLAGRLAPLPGRKVVVWAGDGPPLRWQPALGVRDRNLAAQAPDGEWEDRAGTYQLLNEADAELFPLDPRGLVVKLFGASGPSQRPTTRPVANSAHQELSWTAMQEAAQATGGIALVGNNDLWRMLARAQQQWRHYYLLSFEPPPDPPGQVRYHHIRVRVDRPGVTIHARQGYITQAPQVLNIEHPRPGFDMASASPANLSGIPLRVVWGPWRREGKWRTRKYRLRISVGGAGCQPSASCQLKAGVVVSNARGGIIGQRGYLVNLRAGSKPAAILGLTGQVRVRRGSACIARFMVASRPAGQFGTLVLALDPPSR